MSDCCVRPLERTEDPDEMQEAVDWALRQLTTNAPTAALGTVIGTVTAKLATSVAGVFLSILVDAQSVGWKPHFAVVLVRNGEVITEVPQGRKVLPICATIIGDAEAETLTQSIQVYKKAGWFSWKLTGATRLMTRQEASEVFYDVGDALFVPKEPISFDEPGDYRVSWGTSAGERREAFVKVTPGSSTDDDETNEGGAYSNTAFVVDTSGSMTDSLGDQTKLDAVKTTVDQLLTLLGEENASFPAHPHLVGLVTFAKEAQRLHSLTPDVSDCAQTMLRQEAVGSTNLGAGLEEMLALFGDPADTAAHSYAVVLSDGMSNEGMDRQQILDGPVARAAERSLPVYAVGYGPKAEGEDKIDEELLRTIAQRTKGTYYYATDAYELKNIYLEIRARNFGALLSDVIGTVAQDEETMAKTVAIERGTEAIEVTVSYRGSRLELRARDPHGREVLADPPRVVFSEMHGLARLLVQEPQEGTWTLSVFGADVPDAQEEYRLMVAERMGKQSSGVDEDRLVLAVLLIMAGGLLVIALFGAFVAFTRPMTCADCGAAILRRGNFCEQCGARLVPSPRGKRLR